MRTGWNGPVFLSCASSTQPACCLSFHIADNPRTDVEQISGRHMEFDCRSLSSLALNFVDQLCIKAGLTLAFVKVLARNSLLGIMFSLTHIDANI